MFIEQVVEQLSRMSETEKDQWILSQAKITKESEQQGFFMSLSGEKRIIYMPTEGEIEAFCQKAESGEIYFEYESHYYEFDSEGMYIDEWEVWYNDPLNLMSFLNRVFMGCHDLLLFDEYRAVDAILDKVCRLKFKVVESPNSEDFENDNPVTLIDVSNEGMLSRELSDIGMDWLTAVIGMTDKRDSWQLAEKIVELLEKPICTTICPSMLLEMDLPRELFLYMADVLERRIADKKEAFYKKVSEEKASEIQLLNMESMLKQELARKQEIVFDIRLRCIKENPEEDLQEQKNVDLVSSWKQIKGLFDLLQYGSTRNHSWESEELRKICQDLVRRNDLGQEDWEQRKAILSDIVQYKYYTHDSCSDLMQELVGNLCNNQEEILAFAELLNKFDCYKEKAADLYYQYGDEEKYISYLKTHLGSKSKVYVALINYYVRQGNFTEARQVGELGLAKCKDNLTEIFIYLLADARKNGDKDRYKKLYTSAKRRRGADIERIDKVLKDEDLDGGQYSF